MGIVVTAPEEVVQTTVELPGSKSLSNRLLIMAALSGHRLDLPGLAESQDTHDLVRLLESPSGVLQAGEGGTTFRFALAYLTLQEGTFELHASGRMTQRPIAPLVEALQHLGAEIEYLDQQGRAPVRVQGNPNLPGGTLTIDTQQSSQFATALMLIGPYLKGGLVLELEGQPVSASYLRMTERLMQQSGVPVAVRDGKVFIPAGQYRLGRVQVERDWSAAGYWYAVTALCEGAQVELPGLFANSWQGDRIAAEWFAPLGVETFYSAKGALLMHTTRHSQTLTLHASQYPDMVPTLLVVAACKGVTVQLYGIQHLRHKESNRLMALQRELKQLGGTFAPKDDHWLFTPGELPTTPPEIITYNDHRMAMAFAPAALALGQIELAEKEVVKKSYPHFWTDLQQAGFGIR